MSRLSVSSVKRTLGAYKQMADYVPLVRSRPRETWAYVGWLGQLNAGDDAMHRAHVELFDDVDFWTIPNIGPNPALKALGVVPGFAPPAITMLGGGTLIGNGHFRRTLETWLDAFPSTAPVMLGVGVEDPAFDGPRGARQRQGTQCMGRGVGAV